MHLWALAFGLLWLPGASAAGVTEIPLPEGLHNPNTVAVDGEGMVWMTLDGNWGVARFDPETGSFADFPMPAPKADPATDALYGLAIDAGGVAWTAGQTHLFRVDADGGREAFALPNATLLSGGVHVDGSGRVWVALVTADQVARFDPATQEMTSVATPSQNAFGPLEFAETEGSVFLTATYADTVAELDVEAGRILAGPEPFVAAPTGIAYGGGSLWIGEHGATALVRRDVASGAVDSFPTAPSPYYPGGNSGPSGIVVAPDGAVWFAEHFADRISRFDPATRILVEYEVPSAPGANIQHVAVDPQGRVWFAEWSADRLGYVESGGEQPRLELPEEVRGAAGSTVEVPVSGTPEGEIVAGTGTRDITARFEGQRMLLEVGDVSPGSYHVLVSDLRGQTYVGQYVTLVVDPQDTGEDAAGVELGILVLALVAGVRRRGGDA